MTHRGSSLEDGTQRWEMPKEPNWRLPVALALVAIALFCAYCF